MECEFRVDFSLPHHITRSIENNKQHTTHNTQHIFNTHLSRNVACGWCVSFIFFHSMLCVRHVRMLILWSVRILRTYNREILHTYVFSMVHASFSPSLLLPLCVRILIVLVRVMVLYPNNCVTNCHTSIRVVYVAEEVR